MSNARSFPSAVLVAALVSALVVAAPADAAEPLPPGDCVPAATPAELDLQSGDVGTGWTVSRGRTPQPFSVEVLGIVADGVAPDRDLIVVEASGPPIDAVGGIWSGMSGSPVTVERDGETYLIGAVAYGFSYGPNKIAGLTPAADLVSLNDRGVSTVEGSADADAVRLDTATRRAIAEETGTSAAKVSSTMQRLPVPLSVGVHPDRAASFAKQLRDRGAGGSALIPYAARAAAPSAAATGTIAAGDNFAGVLASGDLTSAGIGTTSYVCDGRAVAFGHPFLASGASAMGANNADALTIIADPTMGPYKMANVAERVGSIDQDRFAGIRARLGVAPPSLPVTSTVVDLDDGTSRDGRTDVHYTPFLSDLAMMHTALNIDTVSDRIGGGSALVTSTVNGTGDGGRTWSLEVANRHLSGYDIAFEALYDLYFDLDELDRNDAEAVTITSVDVDVEVEATERSYEVRRVAVRDPGGSYVPLEDTTLQGGRTEHLRVALRRVDRSGGKLVTTPTEVTVDLTLDVPRDLSGPAILEVTAGPGYFDEDPYDCFFDESSCGATEDLTFDEVLAAIAERPRNDDLVARLLPVDEYDEDEYGEPVERFGDDGVVPLVQTRHRLDRFASGSVAAEVYVEPLPTSKPAYVRGNRWRLRTTLSEGPSEVSFRFGKASDVKLLCDWTGDGASPVVFRDGTWHARRDLSGGSADISFTFGRAGDVPVCGDWNGNGKDSPGVVRGKTWMLRDRMNGGKPTYTFDWGRATDVKVVGDWNGDGKDTPGLRRGSEWLLRNKLASGKATIRFEYGKATSQPVVGDWNFDGKDGVGVVRNGDWRLRNKLSAGKANLRFTFGQQGDTFIAWD